MRPALLTEIPKNSRNRVALEAITSSGASYRLTTEKAEARSNRLPAEIGPLDTCRSFLPLPALWRGWDRRPDHPFLMTPVAESRKRKISA